MAVASLVLLLSFAAVGAGASPRASVGPPGLVPLDEAGGQGSTAAATPGAGLPAVGSPMVGPAAAAVARTVDAPFSPSALEAGLIAVGTNPEGVAVDGSNGRIFVTDTNAANVSVINGSDSAVLAEVGTESSPTGVAFDPLDGNVYAANYGSNTLTVFNATTLEGLGSATVGKEPEAVVYDDANKHLYVADYGAHAVSVLNAQTGGSLGTLSVGSEPIAIAVASTNHRVYVANYGGNSLTVFNGTTDANLGTISLKSPVAATFDPSNRYLYVSSIDNDAVSVVNVTTDKVVTSVDVGSYPYGIAYDAADGDIVVADYGSANLTWINASANRVTGSLAVPTDTGYGPQSLAVLGSDGLVVVASGPRNELVIVAPHVEVQAAATPTESEVGVPIDFSSEATLGLSPYLSYAWAFGDGSTQLASTNQTLHDYSEPGRYRANVTVTDAGGVQANATVNVTVAAPPVASTPVGSMPSGDVGEPVTFVTSASLGTAPYVVYSWSGLPTGCAGASSPMVNCTPTSAGNYSVRATVTDALGVTSAPSSPLPFLVWWAPYAQAPSANRSTADVGQPVEISEVAAQGPGSFSSFLWSGLSNASCTGLATAYPTCEFLQPGFYSIAVRATDSNGITTPESPPLSFQVSSLPTVVGLTPSRGSADLNQTVEISAAVRGGFGADSYTWTGLPSTGCLGLGSATVSCTMETPGPIIASLVVTDADGGRSAPGPGVSLEAYSDPTLSTLLVSPTSVGVNGTVTFNATLSGGSGSDTFNWTGLPTGCTSEGSAAVCHPGQTGVFHVTLSATDGNGYSVTSSVATLAVGAASGPLGGPGGAILGVSAPLFYVLAGAAALLLAGVAALALLRRKRT